jgi:hypothetical protein
MLDNINRFRRVPLSMTVAYEFGNRTAVFQWAGQMKWRQMTPSIARCERRDPILE